jgi:hypothetical protein
MKPTSVWQQVAGFAVLAVVIVISAFVVATIARGDDGRQQVQPFKTYREILRISGNDEQKNSAKFTVHRDWRVTCVSSKVGPDPDIRIFADPDAGTFNTEVLHMADGTRTIYMAEPGIYHLTIAGFDASWTVTVEDAP